MDTTLLLDDIFGRVSISSSEEISIKLEYTLDELSKKRINNYTVECYIFIPLSLNINPNTYPPEVFYHNIQNYLRFKTPVIKIPELIDPNSVSSPLHMLEVLKGELSVSVSPDTVERAIKELKMLGCIVKARLRDYGVEINNLLEHVKVDVTNKDLEEFIPRLFMILKKLREIKEAYKGSFPSQKKLLRYFNITEEFINNLIEFELSKLFFNLSVKYGKFVVKDNILKNIYERLAEEKEYSKNNKYRLHFDASEKDKEKYLYYMNQYKKYLATVLFLNVERKKQTKNQSHIVASIAAFIASVIATLATLPLATTFSQKNARDFLIFAILVSIVYIFKDRAKEVVKLLYNPKVLSKFADYDTNIYDSDDSSVRVGNLREKFKFISKNNVDPTVLSMREETRKEDHLADEMMENIILYQKEININASNILSHHTRTIDINDIIRYNIKDYLLRMSDPDEDIYFFDKEKKVFSRTNGSRSYFINIVLKYKIWGENNVERIHYERYRIVARKSGIERIEMVNRV